MQREGQSTVTHTLKKPIPITLQLHPNVISTQIIL